MHHQQTSDRSATPPAANPQPSASSGSPRGPARPSFYRLADLPVRELQREFVRGITPQLDDLAGWEFRGLNHNRGSRLLGIRKFVKGFYRQDDDVFGYNLVTRQNPITEEWIGKPSDNSPKRHGFYRVRPVRAEETDNAHLHALLLDYGQGENPRFDITSGLRDYLVQVDDDVYVGAAYYALGSRRVRLPSFFILDRFRRGV